MKIQTENASSLINYEAEELEWFKNSLRANGIGAAIREAATWIKGAESPGDVAMCLQEFMRLAGVDKLGKS